MYNQWYDISCATLYLPNVFHLSAFAAEPPYTPPKIPNDRRTSKIWVEKLGTRLTKSSSTQKGHIAPTLLTRYLFQIIFAPHSFFFDVRPDVIFLLSCLS